MQTSYSQSPAIGRVGQIADSRRFRHLLSCMAAGLVAVGRSVFRVPVYGAAGVNSPHNTTIAYQNPDPAAAADVDAILATGGASAAAEAVWTGAELNGVVGEGLMYPARKFTFVFSNHTDWDATTGVARFYGQDGQLVSEDIAIPNGGNATVTSTGTGRQFKDFTVPAQTGTGGTFTIGIAALDSSVTMADWEGIAVYDPMAGGGITDTVANGAEYEDGDCFAAMRKGAIWVVTEDACVAGGDVYTRISGSGDIGAFRSDADSASAIQITGARYGRTSAAGALNIVELY